VGYDLYVQMVAEAVADMKGEPIRPAVEVKIDIPSDAHLPADYVAREDLRLEAYRRLASVVTEGEVDDIRAEWSDRFGPLPEPAEGLLGVARLRVECLRTGVREVSATAARPGQGATAGGRRLVARLAPLALPASARVRLRRLRPEALYKEEVGQLMVPLAPGEAPVEALTALVRALVPDESPGSGRGEASAPVDGARSPGRDSSRATARR
jgi:transcription-repair coupling factor (superfamily II helicase)